jgi:dephospho-CoA kinase
LTTDKLVLASTGMPGSGKSLIVEVAKERNYDIVMMGDVVREEIQKRGLPSTPENIGKTMLELRQLEGKAVIARRCVPKIKETQKLKVLVDGVRSLDEVEEFKKNFPKFSIIAVHASPETRFKRLYDRKRSDDSTGWKIFHEREMRELSVGLGNAIAMAQHVIINEESPEVAKEKVREVFSKVERKWMK